MGVDQSVDMNKTFSAKLFVFHVVTTPAPCRAEAHRRQTGRNPAAVRTIEMR